MSATRWLAGVLALGAVLCSGCGTLPDGRRWGGEATALPGWRQTGRRAWRAALDPQTWAPLAAAALLQIDDMDHELSDWAVEHTPLFGSPDKAEDATGWTGNLLDYALYTSMILPPSGDGVGEWILNRAGGVAVEFTSVGVAGYTVDVLKETTARTRPNGANDRSLPSNHATRSSVDVTLAARNLDATPMPAAARWTAQAGLYGLGVAASWSRVEAAGHYPSDVLVGWALGHFWGTFVHDAFLWRGEPPVLVEVAPVPGGAQLVLRVPF